MPDQAPDPYRDLFLKQIEVAIEKTASLNSLAELLRAATPDFTLESAQDPAKREKALRTLKLRLHPDKHNNDKTATQLFQKLEKFIAEAVRKGTEPVGNKRERDRGNVRATSQKKFPAEANWLFFETNLLHANNLTVDDPDKITTVNCANLRAQIMHGRAIPSDQLFSRKYPSRATIETIKNASAAEIKTELLRGGPVVSKSFAPGTAFMKQHKSDFSKAVRRSYDEEDVMPVVIVGWKQAAFGEAWLVQKIRSDKEKEEQPRSGKQKLSDQVVEVGFHQFNIEDEIEFIKSEELQDKEWQWEPYLELPKNHCPQAPGGFEVVWTTCPHFLHRLWSAIADSNSSDQTAGLVRMANENKVMELHEKGKRSASRPARLREMTYKKDTKAWVVIFEFLSLDPKQRSVPWSSSFRTPS